MPVPVGFIAVLAAMNAASTVKSMADAKKQHAMDMAGNIGRKSIVAPYQPDQTLQAGTGLANQLFMLRSAMK